MNGEQRNSTLKLTKRLLSETYDADVKLGVIGAPRPEGERHLVLRCELTHEPNNAPRTAIVKCAQQHENDIQVGGFISSDMLLNEWASLDFCATWILRLHLLRTLSVEISTAG